MLRQRGNPGLAGRLREKSIEAYVLALETINRVSLKYRVELSAYLICNAWELLLKAKIVSDARNPSAIYYSKQAGLAPRSLSLRDCLQRVFPNENDPVRRNIARIVALRDDAVHLVIGQIPNDVLSLFQAAILNYYAKLSEWYSVVLSDRYPTGMLSVVYDLSPEQPDLSGSLMRRRLGRSASEYLLRLQGEIREERAQLGNSVEYYIPIQYSVRIEKSADGVAVVLNPGDAGPLVHVVEVAKRSSKTHPYIFSELALRVSDSLPSGTRVNGYDIQCINIVYSVKKKAEFYFQDCVKDAPGQYSQKYADWIVGQHAKDARFFERTRQQYLQMKQKSQFTASPPAAPGRPGR